MKKTFRIAQNEGDGVAGDDEDQDGVLMEK
jgi:hypothetical protein